MPQGTLLPRLPTQHGWKQLPEADQGAWAGSAPAQRKRGASHNCQPKGRASGRRSAHCAHSLPEPPPQLPGQGGDHTSTGTFSGSLLHDPHRHTGRPTDQSITPASQMRKPRLSHGQQEWRRAGPSHNPRAPSSTLPSHFQRSLPQSGEDPLTLPGWLEPPLAWHWSSPQ